MPATQRQSLRQKRQQFRERIRAEIRRLKATGLTYEEIAPRISRKFEVDLNNKNAVHYYVTGIPDIDKCCAGCLRPFIQEKL